MSALLVALLLWTIGSAAVAAPTDNLALPDGIPENARKDVEAAIDAFNELMSAKEDEDVNIRAVIQKLESANGKVTKVAVLYHYLGIAYQKAEKFSMAKRRLETALNINPKFHEALVEYGDVFVWLNDHEKAVEQYDKALEIAPEYVLGMQRKASALISLGKFVDAQSLLTKAEESEKTEVGQELLKDLARVIEGPNWKETFVVETKNYVVKTSVSERFAEQVAERAERIHAAYTKVFSKIKKADRKFPIFVHESKEQYVANGGPPGAGGHYEPAFRILVLFKYPEMKNTELVLNHEAFHQFLHDYIDRAPQWFNEGVADYFGPFVYNERKKRLEPRANEWRLGYLQSALRARVCPTSADLMTMSRREMYHPQRIGIHYAQSWGMIHFIFEGKKAGYRNVLVKYFKLLQGGADIEEAYEKTFGKIDMERFDREWQSHVNSLVVER